MLQFRPISVRRTLETSLAPNSKHTLRGGRKKVGALTNKFPLGNTNFHCSTVAQTANRLHTVSH